MYQNTQCLSIARQNLETLGISSSVVSIHTVKSLSADVLLNANQNINVLITAEEHCIYGGRGKACTSTLNQHGTTLPFKIVGISGKYTGTGKQLNIFDHCRTELALKSIS